MTNSEFFRIAKHYKLPIKKATKNNILEWVKLEPRLMKDITTLIFSQKTITRGAYFVLEKKWFFEELRKQKQELTKKTKQIERQLNENEYKSTEELLRLKFLFVKFKRFLDSTKELEEKDLEKNKNKGETNIILSILKSATNKALSSIIITDYGINDETIAISIADTSKYNYRDEIEEILNWGILTEEPKEPQFKAEQDLEEIYKKILKKDLLPTFERVEQELKKLILKDFAEKDLITKEYLAIQKAIFLLEKKEQISKTYFDNVIASLTFTSNGERIITKEENKVKFFTIEETNGLVEENIVYGIFSLFKNEVDFYLRGIDYYNKEEKKETITYKFIDLLKGMKYSNDEKGKEF